jgi:hypothetical protein
MELNIYVYQHYWNLALCLVSRALGKRQKTLDKPFADECHTQQSRDDTKFNSKVGFAGCLSSGTQQSLYRVPIWHTAKKSSRHS